VVAPFAAAGPPHGDTAWPRSRSRQVSTRGTPRDSCCRSSRHWSGRVSAVTLEAPA
jgi:hypothetical protein